MTAEPGTAAEAFRLDVAQGFAPISSGVDGSAIIIATIVSHLPHATSSDRPRFIESANEMASDLLADAFPDAIIPRALPGHVELGPLVALAEAIREKLPNLSAYLTRLLLAIGPHGEIIEADLDSGEGAVDLETLFQQHVDAHNDRPQAALAGLTPNQMFELIDGDWLTFGPLRLDRTLSPGDLGAAPLLQDVRAILLHLRDVGPLPATATGKLSRASVAELRPKLATRHDYLDRGLFKVINEDDVFWLSVSRNVLTSAKLITRRSGSFRLAKRGRLLLADNQAGELFATIFIELFRKWDLRNLDRLDGETGLQSAIAASFYLLGEHAGEWKAADRLAEAAWPAAARGSTPPSPAPSSFSFDRAAFTFANRVLRPLVVLGLMEERKVERETTEPDTEYRLTPLYRRFLRFDLSRPSARTAAQRLDSRSSWTVQ